MGILDFFDGLGESADKFKQVKVDSYLQSRISFMEILVNRGVMSDDFKNELIEKYISDKLSKDTFEFNIKRSIDAYEAVKLKFTSVDVDIFKLKNDTLEYVGEIDKMPNEPPIYNPNSGKMSYNFALLLFEHLKNKEISFKEVNYLSDALDVKIQRVYNKELLTDGAFLKKT